ncbi:unnamed protein product, partial [Musa banksii]
CPLRTRQSRCLPKSPRSATNSNFISRILWRGMIIGCCWCKHHIHKAKRSNFPKGKR